VEEKLDVGAGGCVRVAAALINRLVDAAHSALHVIVPVAAALNAAVDFEDQTILFDRDFGDLDLVADARGGTVLFANLRPLVPVIGTGDVEIEGLLRAR
jgi:hypothetical protein